MLRSIEVDGFLEVEEFEGEWESPEAHAADLAEARQQYAELLGSSKMARLMAEVVEEALQMERNECPSYSMWDIASDLAEAIKARKGAVEILRYEQWFYRDA